MDLLFSMLREGQDLAVALDEAYMDIRLRQLYWILNSVTFYLKGLLHSEER